MIFDQDEKKKTKLSNNDGSESKQCTIVRIDRVTQHALKQENNIYKLITLLLVSNWYQLILCTSDSMNNGVNPSSASELGCSDNSQGSKPVLMTVVESIDTLSLFDSKANKVETSLFSMKVGVNDISKRLVAGLRDQDDSYDELDSRISREEEALNHVGDATIANKIFNFLMEANNKLEFIKERFYARGVPYGYGGVSSVARFEKKYEKDTFVYQDKVCEVIHNTKGFYDDLSKIINVVEVLRANEAISDVELSLQTTLLRKFCETQNRIKNIIGFFNSQSHIAKELSEVDNTTQKLRGAESDLLEKLEPSKCIKMISTKFFFPYLINKLNLGSGASLFVRRLVGDILCEVFFASKGNELEVKLQKRSGLASEFFKSGRKKIHECLQQLSILTDVAELPEGNWPIRSIKNHQGSRTFFLVLESPVNGILGVSLTLNKVKKKPDASYE